MSVVERSAFCFVAGIVTVLAFAGTEPAPTEKVVAGPCDTVFGVKVCTSYRTRSGKVTEFSLRVPVAAMEQAPANAPMVWPPKPEANVHFAPVVEEQTGFTFANIYWEAGGHPPDAYMVPHFDFHFYFAPEGKVQEIDCKDASKPRTLAAGTLCQMWTFLTLASSSACASPQWACTPSRTPTSTPRLPGKPPC